MKKKFFKLFLLITTIFSFSSCTPNNFPYTITFDGNGGILVSGSEIQTIKSPSEIVAPVYEKENYDFSGWDKDLSTISGTSTVFAQWELSSDVSMEIDGFTRDGTDLKGKTDNEITSFSFVNKVHVNKYASWKMFKDKEGREEIFTKTINLVLGDNTVYIIVSSPNGESELYTVTVRRLNIFNITFDSDGGSAVAPIAIQEENILRNVPTSTKEGHSFKGWDYDFSKPIMSDINTKALWDINLYNVYLVNSDTSKGAVSGAGSFKYNSSTSIVATTYPGYKFVGWYKDGIKVSDSHIYQITIPSHDVTYIANWSNLIEPTLTIDDYNNQWGYTIGSGDYRYNQEVTITAVPNSGCSFDGWYSNGLCLSTDLSYTFIMPDTSLVISSIFSKKGQSFSFAKENSTLSILSCQCTNSSVEIPEYGVYQDGIYQIASIGESAFEGSFFKSIVIHNGLSSIGEKAFYSCDSLETINIPGSVTSIGASAFEASGRLVIYCEAESKPDGWDSAWNRGNRPVYWGCVSTGSINDFNYVVQQINGVKQIAISKYIGSKSVVDNIPSEINVDGTNIPVTSIGHFAFYCCSSITSVTIPSSVTSIGHSAFEFCSKLTNVTLPNSITSIGSSAFGRASSLSSITIPNSVTSIGSSAFAYCSRLEPIIIPRSVISIGGSAFRNCTSLKLFYCEAESKPDGWASTWNDSWPVYWGYVSTGSINDFNYVVQQINGVKQIAISKYIGSKSVVDNIPSEINVDGTNIPVTSIGIRAFSETSITAITIPNSVTSICHSAFQYCASLLSINIPDSVLSIGDYAFCGCSSLSSITIPNSVTSIGSYAFSYCHSLASIIIPNSVTTIGEGAFWEASLTSITIPNSVTLVSNYIFYHCVSLKSVNISDSTSSIGNFAFYYCSGLSSVTIPNSVTSIGSSAFAYCSTLAILDLSCCDHVIYPGSDFLKETKDTLEIKVKASLENQYKTSPYWRKYANQIIGV